MIMMKIYKVKKIFLTKNTMMNSKIRKILNNKVKVNNFIIIIMKLMNKISLANKLFIIMILKLNKSI